jgi:flagellar export protein FliJ
MPFRFPLAAVLMVREHAEQREERALKKLRLEMARSTRELEELDAEIAHVQAEREQAMQAPIPAVQLQAYEERAEVAMEEKKILVVQIQKLRLVLAEQMKVYQASHRDREALTDMMEKQRDEYDQEQSRAQQKQLDDMFMARRHRN